MQKIQSYLYPNRVIAIADLAGFTTENKIVYARTVKLYKGVDNVIEFDVQNADQKRLNLVTSPSITIIRLNVMDSNGKSLPNSPYTVTPSATVTGIATVTIPGTDLASLSSQFLKYSVTAVNAASNTIPLYTDSRFSAVGTMEVVESAVGVTRANRTYNTFTGEIDFAGNVMHRSSCIPAKFYEAIKTTTISFDVHMTAFIGSVWIEGTTDMTISVNSFLNATKLQTYTTATAVTATQTFSNIPVGNYNYFRITWQWPSVNDPTTNMNIYGSYSGFAPDNGPGKVDLITVY
jgi:hypothetical protein